MNSFVLLSIDIIDFTITFLYVTFFLIILIGILRSLVKRTEVTDHWYHLFDEGQFSSVEVYQSIVDELESMKIPHVYFEKVNRSEGGLFTDNRLYIVVSRSSLSYIICAAPFGTSFFVSWRQGEPRKIGQRLLAGIPILGPILEGAFYKKTYYQEDTRIMFRDTVHNTVLKIVDAIALKKGVRGLTELERNPILAKR